MPEGWTSLPVHPETRDRLKNAKPFESMNNDEMVNLLLDQWEETDE